MGALTTVSPQPAGSGLTSAAGRWGCLLHRSAAALERSTAAAHRLPVCEVVRRAGQQGLAGRGACRSSGGPGVRGHPGVGREAGPRRPHPLPHNEPAVRPCPRPPMCTTTSCIGAGPPLPHPQRAEEAAWGGTAGASGTRQSSTRSPGCGRSIATSCPCPVPGWPAPSRAPPHLPAPPSAPAVPATHPAAVQDEACCDCQIDVLVVSCMVRTCSPSPQ